MTLFYQVPYRTTPKHAGMWWLPGLGAEGAVVQPTIELLPTPDLVALADRVKAIKGDMAAGKLVFVPRNTPQVREFARWVLAYCEDDEARKMLDPMLGLTLGQAELYDASGKVVVVPPELRAGHPVDKELWAVYEDGIDRCKLMREEQGVLLLEPDKDLKAFLDWWRVIDPATLAANLAINESGAIVTFAPVKLGVPQGLYNYWVTNPTATSVPDRLLARAGFPWMYFLAGVAAGGAVGYYLIRKPKRGAASTRTRRSSSVATTRRRNTRKRRVR
jgi:hypothetical protein